MPITVELPAYREASIVRFLIHVLSGYAAVYQSPEALALLPASERWWSRKILSPIWPA